jgi:DNA-binding NarL/FixJ family response regulator
MSEQIRVIVIEQEALYRRGLVAVLDSTSDLHAAGSAETAKDAYRLADVEQPDVALVGTTVTDAPGIELAAELRRRHPAIAVVVNRGQRERRRTVRGDSGPERRPIPAGTWLKKHW